MEALAQLLAAVPFAGALRGSATIYALVSAAHVLGIALLVGPILVLDLRVLGLLPGPPLPVMAPFLSRIAGFGLGLAIATGLLLLSVSPAEYLANPAFRLKAILLVLMALNIVLVHRGADWRTLRNGGPAGAALKLQATISAAGWLGVLMAGRMIGFV